MRWILLLGCAGCVSFQAVDATADLGKRVGAFQHTLDGLTAWCRLSVAAGTQAEAECLKQETDARRFALIPVRLAAWSEALHRMATDGGSGSLAPEVAELAHVALPAGAAGGIGAALDGLMRLATNGYRRRALDRALRDAAPHVALLVSYARGIVAVQKEHLTALEEQSRQIGSTILPKTPEEIAAALAMVQLASWLHQSWLELDEYDRALVAFGAAHARLAAGVGKPDAQLYGEILSDLKTVLGEVKR
jgi:hypothetical protein